MKRILLALLISFFFVAAYLTVLAVMFVMNNYDVRTINYFHSPLRLPQATYFYFFPPTLQDYQPDASTRKMILGASFFAINILLYSIPVYFIMFLISKFRKPKPMPTDEPPPPPSF